jgi:hypothetical protein
MRVGRKENEMIRTGLLAALIVGLAMAAAARAQNTQPDNDDARFTFHRADDGYLRLDGRSGQVSICTRRPVGWLCQAVPDDRAALEAEINRLQTDNIALKRELLSHNLALPNWIKPEPPARVEEPRLQVPSDAELNRVMVFIEKVWRRLVEMVATTQRDILKKP